MSADDMQMNLESLLLAASDGELDADQQARLEAHLRDHPDDQARIDFERHLREACSQVMGLAIAPSGLSDRILADISTDSETELVADRLEARAGQTRDPRFWSRITPAFRAVAAAVLLLVGGTFLYQMVILGSGSVSPAQAAHMSEIASFVGTEHDRCLIDPSRAAKFTISELGAAPQLLEDIVGKSISPADLSLGDLVFRDGGRCDVPGGGQSVHLRFDVAKRPGETVSLFIQHVASSSDELFEAGKSYELRPDNRTDNSVVYGWVADGLNYFLVASDRDICEDYRIASGLAPSDG